MEHLLGVAVVVLALMGGNRSGWAQVANTSAQVTQAIGTATSSEQKKASSNADTSAQPTGKQLALQAQTDRLLAMATELRDQVDKTNKNILSIKVVHKAEEIEQFAKRLKEQARK